MSERLIVTSADAYRAFDAAAGTIELGSTSDGARFAPQQSVEFILRIGDASESAPSSELRSTECEIVSVTSESQESLTVEYKSNEHKLNILVHSSADPGARLRKRLSIRNVGDNPIVVYDVVLEQILIADGVCAFGGGRGWPVFLEGLGFAAVEFPEAENILSDSGYSLEYYPRAEIAPGETMETASAVFQVYKGDSRQDLLHYVRDIQAGKHRDFLALYATRGAHDCEGPNAEVANEQFDHIIDLKENWQIPFEFFILDLTSAGEAFPQCFSDNRFDDLRSKSEDAGIALGIWIQTDMPTDDDSAAILHDSLSKLIQAYGLKGIRIDFTETTDEESASPYQRHHTCERLINFLGSLSASYPDVGLTIEGVSRSPLWLRYVDYLSARREDISDIPAPSLRDSRILHADLDRRSYELDAGTCLGYSDSNYWSGKDYWRKSVVMSVLRTGHLYLSGELHLLDEDDKLFLQRASSLRRIHGASFGVPRRVLGDPGLGEVYGYANVANGRGLVAVMNPSWERRTFEVMAVDLGCDPAVRNICTQLFPDAESAVISADGGHFHARIDPWEVLLLEVGPSEQHSELLESRSKPLPNCEMYVSHVSLPDEVSGSFSVSMDQTCHDGGSTFKKRLFIPRSWASYPLLVDMRDISGDLYINNHPVDVPHSGGFVLIYPWTHEYGLVKYGSENLFYVSSTEIGLVEQREMIIRPVPYFSSSACREDWPYDGDSTMVVIVRYLKDGRPFRHSVEPRTAECAAWLDGVAMDTHRVPPLVPRIWSKFSWSVFMLDLESDWECVRVSVPEMVDCEYEVEFFLAERMTGVYNK